MTNNFCRSHSCCPLISGLQIISTACVDVSSSLLKSTCTLEHHLRIQNKGDSVFLSRHAMSGWRARRIRFESGTSTLPSLGLVENRVMEHNSDPHAAALRAHLLCKTGSFSCHTLQPVINFVSSKSIM